MINMNHMKELPIITLLLIVSLFLSGCRNDDNINRNTVTETSAAVTASTITSEIPAIEAVSKNSDTTTSSQTENHVTDVTTESEAAAGTKYDEYVYSPPAAALEVEFYRDKIIHKLEYTYYSDESTAEVPEYILSDMNDYADKVIEENNFLDESSSFLERIGVDMFDINSDGFDDYVVIGLIVENDSMFYQPYTIEKLYMQDGNNGFQAFDFPASSAKYGIDDYILSTKTNGFNDFIGIDVYGNYFTAVYDGNSAYSEAETFCTGDYRWEYLDNSLAKITVNANGHENEIAVLKFFYDTDRAEHMLLYSSLPDGTPSVSIQHYGSNIFEFYVKRTDKAPEKWYDWGVGPIEIKYIPADVSN